MAIIDDVISLYGNRDSITKVAKAQPFREAESQYDDLIMRQAFPVFETDEKDLANYRQGMENEDGITLRELKQRHGIA